MTENRLFELERQIEGAFWDICAALCEIEGAALYKATHETFSDYLLQRWPNLVTPGTWRQWRASYRARMLAVENGTELLNERAARALRTVERTAREMVVRKAVQMSGKSLLSAADILAVAETVAEVLETAAQTGFVDTGNGEMSALEAAVDVSLRERILRERQQYIERQKANGWSAPMILERIGEMFRIPMEWFGAPPGQRIEIRWRLIPDETSR